MSILKKPDLSDPKLRAKLAKGMGHNYYGEPAWPNDLLYIFPIVIFGTFACVIGLSVMGFTFWISRSRCRVFFVGPVGVVYVYVMCRCIGGRCSVMIKSVIRRCVTSVVPVKIS